MRLTEEMKNWTVYGMIEGEQTFLTALKEACEYLEEEMPASINTKDYNAVIAEVMAYHEENELNTDHLFYI